MLIAALLSVAALHYFSAGRILAAKSRQVHGLDAAAYSGALVQARALNLLAYLNRAQLAHQLAMAHLVTLGSWAMYGGTQAGRLARGNPPAHLIGMLFGADYGRAYTAASRASGLDIQVGTTGALAQAHAAHDHFVQNLYRGLSARVVHGLPEARRAAIHAVLAAHYPELQISDAAVSIVSDNWPGFVRHFAPEAQLRPLVSQVAGMYDFLAPRNDTQENTWVVSHRCPHLRHQLRRRGGTRMDGAGRWQSFDTQSYHALRSNRWIGCYYREYVMGWAWIPGETSQAMDGAYTDDAPDDFSEQDFWRWVEEATKWDLLEGHDNPLANSYAMRGRVTWRGGGLASYYDVSADKADSEPGFSVVFTQSGPEGLAIHAHSSARTYFARPNPRSDGRHERPNLFHPYWHAALAPGRAPAGRL